MNKGNADGPESPLTDPATARAFAETSPATARTFAETSSITIASMTLGLLYIGNNLRVNLAGWAYLEDIDESFPQLRINNVTVNRFDVVCL